MTNSNFNNANRGNNETFSFNIQKIWAQIGERKSTGFAKELNYVSFHGAAPRWDLREWDAKHTRMSKGMTFNDEEFVDLWKAVNDAMDELQKGGSITSPKRPQDTAEMLKMVKAAHAAEKGEMKASDGFAEAGYGSGQEAGYDSGQEPAMTQSADDGDNGFDVDENGVIIEKAS